jgi:hypothetical protein
MAYASDDLSQALSLLLKTRAFSLGLTDLFA